MAPPTSSKPSQSVAAAVIREANPTMTTDGLYEYTALPPSPEPVTAVGAEQGYLVRPTGHFAALGVPLTSYSLQPPITHLSLIHLVH